ncbi:hypothetical protein IFM89_022977 [Coptis chinensis]|uniref:F-box domain-containing protein n=1 Tax=Coptis chinensis TaxID=261450 RepID=A0A835M980_9MAGN|nr:hypothetical protein IFM89_022977 [Coptis chinensis]
MSDSESPNQHLISKKRKHQENEQGELVIQGFEITGIMSKLPLEVFFEILSRVDIETLTQVRWVSKAWYNTIKHPRFVKMQHEKVIQDSTPFVIYYDLWEKDYYLVSLEEIKYDEPEMVNIYKAKLPKPLRQIHSCNGLVFSCSPPYYVCNPVTGEQVVVPEPPMSEIEVLLTGFGYDPVSQVFKVIRILQDSGRNNCDTSAEVYNFRSGKWRYIHDVLYNFNKKNVNVFLNGALHWIGAPYENGASGVIISFKLDTEEFHQLPLPSKFCSGRKKNCLYLSVLGGRLHLVHTISKKHIQVWVMKEYGMQSSWVKKYVVDDLKLENEYNDEYQVGPYELLELMKNGDIIFCSNHDLGYKDPESWELKIFYTSHEVHLNSAQKTLCRTLVVVSTNLTSYDSETEVKEEGELELQEFEITGIMSKLPIEIFFEILSRVVVETLTEVRWASKAWYNTVKHPRFVKMQHKKAIQSNTPFVIYFDIWKKIFYLVSLEEIKEDERAMVNIYEANLPTPLHQIHSCHGLVFFMLTALFCV